MTNNRILVVSLCLVVVAVTVLGISLALASFVPQSAAEAQDGTSQNSPPEITSTPVTDATVGQQYMYQVEATDPDGDALTFSLNASPTGMIIDDATGLILWTPDSSQVGDHQVEVVAEDVANGLSDRQNFTISVAPEPSGGPPNNNGDVSVGNEVLMQTSISIINANPSEEAVREAISLGLDTLIGSRPLPTEGVNEAQKVHDEFSAHEQEFAQVLDAYLQKVGPNVAHHDLALNALQVVRETTQIAKTLAPITAQCGPGDFVLQAETNNFFNPCSQLQPLINSNTGLENEPVFSPDDTVFGQVDPTFKPIDPLTRSYSVNLRADLVPPRWSRDIPEHVEITEPLSPGECSVVFKEFRGLLLQLHIEGITTVKDPGNKSGLSGTTSEPIWVLRWMPAQYGKQWSMCNTGNNRNPEVTTTVTRQIVEDEGLVYFWRFYE